MKNNTKRQLSARLWKTADNLKELYSILADIDVDGTCIKDMQDALKSLDVLTERIIKYGDEIASTITPDEDK